MLKFKTHSVREESPTNSVMSSDSTPSSWLSQSKVPPGDSQHEQYTMREPPLNNNESFYDRESGEDFGNTKQDSGDSISHEQTPPGELVNNMESASDKDICDKLEAAELQQDELHDVVPDSDSGDNSSTAPVSRTPSSVSQNRDAGNSQTDIEEVTEEEGVLVVNGKTVDKSHRQKDMNDGNTHIQNGDHEEISRKGKNKSPDGRRGSLLGKLLKKFTRPTESEVTPSNAAKLERIIQEVHVDTLPQVFVTKYLGLRLCADLYGLKATRGPVDEMIASVQGVSDGDDLPLVQLRVSRTGIHVKEHSANKSKETNIERGMIPIEFISYGVQDVKFTRVFSFILVREISSRTRELECHAYVCDTTVSARRLALSVSLAFKTYTDSLQGQPFKFQVDLGSQKDNQQDTNSKDVDA